MGIHELNTLANKEKRISDVLALTEPDRVPFAPKIGIGGYAQIANISMYEALMDFRTMKPGIVKFLEQYEPDLYWSPAGYPSNVMEVLDTVAIKWPGPTCGVNRHMGFQVTDITYMEQEEYDEFLLNPAHFCMTKVYPRRHNKLKGLSKISFSDIVEFGHYVNMSAFYDPEVREAMLSLLSAGEQSAKWLSAQGEMASVAISMKTPIGVSVGQNAPYDMLADNLRGYINVPMDILEIPDKVLAAIDVMTEFALANIRNLRGSGIKYCFMPMHGGTDDMMSNDTYSKFYWPSLRRLIEELINIDIVPYIFFEGKYNTRLDIIKEVPKGKCIYMFEDVDIAKAKKVLGDTVCICGNLPSADLIFSNKQKIIDDTKALIDICAPGGGFIMDCSIVMDRFKEENLDAWYQTTLDYGKYK